VLRGDDDGGDAFGLAVLVFDADLRLAVREKIGQQLFAPHLLELSRQAVRKRDRQRHQRIGLAAGVAEHHTLIARAGFFRRAAVNPARDVRRLGVDADTDAHVFGVKADDGHGVADLGDDLACDGFIVRHIGRGDLAHQVDLIGAGRHLAGDVCVGIVGKDVIEHRVGDLVADFIGMSARDGLRGEIGFHRFRFLSARSHGERALSQFLTV